MSGTTDDMRTSGMIADLKRIDGAIALLREVTSGGPEGLSYRVALSEAIRHAGELRQYYARQLMYSEQGASYGND